MKTRLVIWLILLLGCLGWWGTRFAQRSARRQEVRRGEQLAKLVCAACHLFPEPALLDQATWKNGTLPWMRRFMGLDPAAIENSLDAEYLKQTDAFLESPLVSANDWSAIAAYYLASAPVQMLPRSERPEIQVGLKGFAAKIPPYRTETPMALMLQIDEAEQRIYVGNASSRGIDILSSDGEFVSHLSVDNLPVSLSKSDQGIYVTSIGFFYPREKPAGDLKFFRQLKDGFSEPKVILDNLVRPLQANFADLNHDGKTDFVLSLFGNFGGRFSWFENQGDGNYQEHVLFPKPGALRSEIGDFNGDGHWDIAVLIAQSTESLFLMFGNGAGEFTTTPVFRKPPVFGHTYFEMADFDRDGDPDVLATNGDNGEYPSPFKPYHGIRVYLNDGANHFEERYFFPLHGAFKAMARDFDQDGDLDIAAISYFPDYENSPRESFVLLENQGDFQFEARTFEQSLAGRWLTMDAGDLDGDGDQDIVLGSVIGGPGRVPTELKNSWEQSGLTVLILENQLKN